LRNFTELKKEAFITYDTEKYDFRTLLQKIFGLENKDLALIHQLVPESSAPSFLTEENDQQTWFHETYQNSPHFAQLKTTYRLFVREVIAPLFVDKKLIYQTSPTVRISTPNNLAVSEGHRDGDNYHPLYEINFWIPITKVWGTNGMYVETEEYKGDFHDIQADYGQVFRFYGNRCYHYNKVNDTGVSRIALDFRVISTNLWTLEMADEELKPIFADYYATLDLENEKEECEDANTARQTESKGSIDALLYKS